MSRETLLDESISEPTLNQFTSSNPEISTHIPEQLVLVHDPIPNFQVNPIFIPLDSILDYPTQSESESPSVHSYQIVPQVLLVSISSDSIFSDTISSEFEPLSFHLSILP